MSSASESQKREESKQQVILRGASSQLDISWLKEISVGIGSEKCFVDLRIPQIVTIHS